MAKKPRRKSDRKRVTRKPARKSARKPARKVARKPARKIARKPARKVARRRARKVARTPARSVRRQGRTKRAKASKRATAGSTGLERTLAQTPAAGRTVQGPTNAWPTKRSTGTPSGAGSSRRSPRLERERKRLREVDESVQGPPSSLNMDQHGSAARTGRAELRQAKREHTQTGPAMTGGDVDANWEDAYAVGDETPGGDNPTPDQDVVEDIGKALGVEYQDNEELKSSDKIIERDRHRWELDPASAEDYRDREKE
jgi:hypothetical protein